MKNLFKIELSRAFRNKLFAVSLLIGCIITLSHILFSVAPMVQYLGTEKFGEVMYPHSVFNKWIGGEAYSVQPSLYFMLLPILAVLPYGISFCSDKRSGYLKNVLIRTKRRNYFAAKYSAVFLSGGCAVLLPLLLNLALTACLLPSLRPETAALTFPLGQTSMWRDLFYTQPYLYLAAYLLIDFIFSGLLAALAVALTDLVENRFAILLGPFLLYLFSYYVLIWLGSSRFAPMSFLSPSQFTAGITLGPILAEAVLLFALTFLPFYYRGVKHDIY